MLSKYIFPILSLPTLASVAQAAECNCCSSYPTTCCEQTYCCSPVDDDCCPSGKFSIFADYLLWGVKEDQLQYAIDVPQLNNFNFDGPPSTNVQFNSKEASSQANSGFKLGVGYSTACTSWDFTLFWTYLHGHTQSSISDPTGALFPSQFPVAVFIGLFSRQKDRSPTSANHASNKWTYQFDTLDFQVGKTFFPTCSVFIRSFLGIKGARINQNLSTVYSGFNNFFDSDSQIDVTVKKKNNFLAIGPSIGVESAWLMGCNFSLIGGFSFAYLYGKFDTDIQLTLAQVGGSHSIPFNGDYDTFRLRPTSNAWIGVDWRKSSFFISASYEVQYWWNQWQDPSAILMSMINSSSSAQGDLMLYGLTLQVGFAF